MEIKRMWLTAFRQRAGRLVTGAVRIDPLFQPHARHGRQVPASRSSREPERRGTPIRWGRP